MIKNFLIYSKEIFFLAGRNVSKIKIIFLLSVIIGIIDLLGLSLIGNYVSLALETDSIDLITFPLGNSDLKLMSFLLFAVYFFKLVIGIIANKKIFKTISDVEIDLRIKLLHKYQNLPYQLMTKKNSSEYINAINIWAPQYTRLVLLNLTRLFAESIVAIMILCFLFYVNKSIFITLLTFIVISSFAYDFFLRKKNKSYADLNKKYSSLVITDVRQVIEGIKEIKVLGLEAFFENRIARNGRIISNSQANSNVISSSARFFLEFSLVIFVISITFLITKNSSTSDQIIPVLSIFLAGAARLLTMFNLVNITLTQLAFYRKIVHSLFNDINNINFSSLRELDFTNKTKFSSILVKNLCFSYNDSDKDILSNINFEILKGEKLVFLGPSGSGKSTFVDLLLGIIKPTSGFIEVKDSRGNILSNNASFYSVYLPQSTFLIVDTIRNNIALGQDESNINDSKIIESLKKAHIYNFIKSLPNFLDTEIGDGGLILSGGQKQRIAIARALYLGKSILIFDEATNALDFETEEAILKDLLSELHEVTIIFITHRYDIAKRFNKVYQIKDKSLFEMKIK